jgi:hypothetical protein
MEVLERNNWFLYMVGTECEEKGLSPEEWGVGISDLDPGVADAPYGTMLVAPGNYVSNYFYGITNIRSVTPAHLRKCILSYFG